MPKGTIKEQRHPMLTYGESKVRICGVRSSAGGWLADVTLAGWLADVCRQLPTVLLAGIGWLSAGVDAIALKIGVRLWRDRRDTSVQKGSNTPTIT